VSTLTSLPLIGLAFVIGALSPSELVAFSQSEAMSLMTRSKSKFKS
jgi:hypothetical protein